MESCPTFHLRGEERASNERPPLAPLPLFAVQVESRQNLRPFFLNSLKAVGIEVPKPSEWSGPPGWFRPGS